MEIHFYPYLSYEKDGSLKTNAKGMVPLQMVVWQNGERKTLGVGQSVMPHLWIKEEERVNRKNHPDSAKINSRISSAEAWAQEAEQKLMANQGSATAAEIAEYVKGKLKPWKGKAPEPEQEEAQRRDIASLHAHWQEVNKGYLTSDTLRMYVQVVDQLKTFSPKATIDDIDESFMRKYSASLAKQQMKSSTVHRHYKFVKDMRALVGLNPKEKWLKFTARYSPRPDLTAEEFLKLINAELSTPTMARERDMWVLSTFVPLRPSNFAQLKEHHRKEMKLPKVGTLPVVEFYQGKTQNPVLIPLPPLAVQIWDKYEGNFILPTMQKRGKMMKKIAEEVGLNRTFVLRDMIGTRVKETLAPLYDLVSPYTARHTAASLVYEGSEGDDSLAGWLLGHAQHGIKGTTGVYAKDKAARVLPKILAAWEALLGDKVKWPG